MKITKKCEGFGINVGYTIDVSQEEYEALMDAVDAGAIWHDENGNSKQSDRCRDLYEEMEAVEKRYLTDDEAAPLVNCLCCKNCLPPYQRVNGMCKLDKCKYEPA